MDKVHEERMTRLWVVVVLGGCMAVSACNPQFLWEDESPPAPLETNIAEQNQERESLELNDPADSFSAPASTSASTLNKGAARVRDANSFKSSASNPNDSDAKRVALVIANGDYEAAGYLKNPINDAVIVSDTLRSAGFNVDTIIDSNREEISEALVEFKQAAFGAEIAMIYFAGHGMGADGVNWILPTDASLSDEADLYLDAIDMKAFLLTLRDVSGLRIIVLDACRDNPLSLKRSAQASSRSARNAGFGRIDLEDLSASTLVMYSAYKGQTAADGVGNHSPFAEAFVRRFEEKGRHVSDLLVDIRNDVLTLTNGDQEPFFYGTPKNKFVLIAEPEINSNLQVSSQGLPNTARVTDMAAIAIKGTWAYPEKSCERMSMTVDVASAESGDSLLLSFSSRTGAMMAEPVELTDERGAIHVSGVQPTVYHAKSDILTVSTNGTEMQFTKCA